MRNLRHAFTLVELLVVLAIVGILIGLILPMSRAVRERSNQTGCAGNLHQWGVFWGQYLTDHDGFFSDGMRTEDVESGDETQRVGWHRGEWATVLRPYYLHRKSMLVCPSATEPLRNAEGTVLMRGGPRSTYVHGSIPGQLTAERSSYGINCWVYNPPRNVVHIQNRETVKNWRRLSSTPKASFVPLMLDSMWRGGGPDQDMDRSIKPPSYNGEWRNTEYEMHHFAIDRHQGGIQMVFFDFSVRHLRVRELWKMKWHRKFNQNASYAWPFPAWIAGTSPSG